jgi:hypothetical protein
MTNKIILDENTLEQLRLLFDFAPPESIRRTMTELFVRYILTHHALLPEDFETIASDFYYLLQFLQDIEEEMKE